MPELSIVIPVYNVEKYLSQCLDSVLPCDASACEVIAVDDGSTDSSPEILKLYGDRFPELLRIITQPNGCIGAARNTGLEAATGKYIVFLDSDDYYSPGAISEMLEECRKDFDICVFDFMNVNERCEFIDIKPGCAKKDGFFTLGDYPFLLAELPSATNKIFRRSLFIENNIRFPGRVLFEDYRIVPRLYPFAEKICYTPAPWYCYRQQAASITHGTNADKNLQIIDASQELLDYYKSIGLYDKYYNELEYCVFYNEFLTSIDRVNLIDRHSPVQDRLKEYFLNTFPDYKRNPYVKAMGQKYYFLTFLIITGQYNVLNHVLTLNNARKNKN